MNSQNLGTGILYEKLIKIAHIIKAANGTGRNGTGGAVTMEPLAPRLLVAVAFEGHVPVVRALLELDRFRTLPEPVKVRPNEHGREHTKCQRRLPAPRMQPRRRQKCAPW